MASTFWLVTRWEDCCFAHTLLPASGRVAEIILEKIRENAA
jgi:hypothetical protein